MGYALLQGQDKHRSLFEAFGSEHPESVSTMGGARGQMYAAAARSGSLPTDSGESWPRSVVHGPEKHRSLFEAFAGLRDCTHEGALCTACPSSGAA